MVRCHYRDVVFNGSMHDLGSCGPGSSPGISISPSGGEAKESQILPFKEFLDENIGIKGEFKER